MFSRALAERCCFWNPQLAGRGQVLQPARCKAIRGKVIPRAKPCKPPPADWHLGKRAKPRWGSDTSPTEPMGEVGPRLKPRKGSTAYPTDHLSTFDLEVHCRADRWAAAAATAMLALVVIIAVTIASSMAGARPMDNIPPAPQEQQPQSQPGSGNTNISSEAITRAIANILKSSSQAQASSATAAAAAAAQPLADSATVWLRAGSGDIASSLSATTGDRLSRREAAIREVAMKKIEDASRRTMTTNGGGPRGGQGGGSGGRLQIVKKESSGRFALGSFGTAAASRGGRKSAPATSSTPTTKPIAATTAASSSTNNKPSTTTTATSSTTTTPSDPPTALPSSTASASTSSSYSYSSTAGGSFSSASTASSTGSPFSSTSTASSTAAAPTPTCRSTTRSADTSLPCVATGSSQACATFQPDTPNHSATSSPQDASTPSTLSSAPSSESKPKSVPPTSTSVPPSSTESADAPASSTEPKLSVFDRVGAARAAATYARMAAAAARASSAAATQRARAVHADIEEKLESARRPITAQKRKAAPWSWKPLSKAEKQTTSGHSMLMSSSVQARAPPSRPEENTAEAMESYEETMTKYLTGEVTPGQMLYVVDLVQKQVAKITTEQSTFEGLTANMYPEDPKAWAKFCTESIFGNNPPSTTSALLAFRLAFLYDQGLQVKLPMADHPLEALVLRILGHQHQAWDSPHLTKPVRCNRMANLHWLLREASLPALNGPVSELAKWANNDVKQKCLGFTTHLLFVFMANIEGHMQSMKNHPSAARLFVERAASTDDLETEFSLVGYNSGP
eukprot:gene23873-9443_t